MKNNNELAADTTADDVHSLPKTDAANTKDVVSQDHDDSPVEEESTDSASHGHQQEEETLCSTPSSSHKRKFCEAWEEDTDINILISEGTGEAFPISTQGVRPMTSASRGSPTTKTFAEEIEAEEARRAKKRQRTKQMLKAVTDNSVKPSVAASNSDLKTPPGFVAVKDHSPNVEQDQPPTTRDWSSSEMLGIVAPEAKNIPYTKESERRPGLILRCHAPLSPFLPQRLLPPARWGKLGPTRINIPMSDWNQDISSMRNPLDKRASKIPSRLYTNSGAMEAQLRVASWKNEIYAARNIGIRHPEDPDREYWGAEIPADEETEECEEQESKGIIREVSATTTCKVTASVPSVTRNKRIIDGSYMRSTKIASSRRKSTQKSRAESQMAKSLREAARLNLGTFNNRT